MITLVYRKKILRYTIDNWYCFLCFLTRGIRFWHPFCLIWSRFCCTETGHFFLLIEIWKIIFRPGPKILTNMVDFYVFWGEESENDISFYPSRIDFAVRYNAIFYHFGKMVMSYTSNFMRDGYKLMPLSDSSLRKHRK